MKKMNLNISKKLNESEREELIRLRAEIEYIKTENAVIKKEIPLREEKRTAQLNTRRQQSSKNSEKKEYQLKYLLKKMKIAKSTYYYGLNKVDAVAMQNKDLMTEIKIIFEQNKDRYGVIRVYNELHNWGICVNHKRVHRLMHTMNLFGKRPKVKYKSYRDQVGKVADNVIARNFTVTVSLQKWTTDVSQISFSWWKCYISQILNMYTNEFVSYDLSLNPNMEQIQHMLEKAFKNYHQLRNLFLIQIKDGSISIIIIGMLKRSIKSFSQCLEKEIATTIA